MTSNSKQPINQLWLASYVAYVKLSFLLIIIQSTLYAEETELNLEQMLLMPGDVISAHAEYETKCESCHVHFEKDNQSPLCIDCHEVVEKDINDKAGFHGKLSDSQLKDCHSCHTEHKGRAFDITGLDKEFFDHSKTDFDLKGKHLGVDCQTCHQQSADNATKLPDKITALPIDKGYRFKEFNCSSCHEDYHQQSLGDDCSDCHTEKGWVINTFDHDKTDFKISGKHEDAECVSCHINNQFKDVEPECKSCHLASDQHLGIFGDKCEDCHSAEQWTETSFVHTEKTESTLIGNHLETSCVSCHEKVKKPPTDCIQCHESNDVHHGNNGEQCQDCHNQKAWDTLEFEHKTPLTDKHLTLPCASCHTAGEKRNESLVDRNCFDCHKPIDAHSGNLGERCQTCHQTKDWNESVKFNHDFSTFALTGSHQILVCEACHVSVEFSSQSASCISCHDNDDYHKQTLGNECENCHDASIWGHWQFNHEQQTEYPLTGSHEDLKCELCHDKALPEPLKPDTDCFSCHLDDDVHTGSFGMDCQQCHNTEKFDDNNF